MEWRMAGEKPEISQALATELLDQAERCVSAGLLRPAEALLTQAWTIGEQYDPDIASTAAWGVACLLVRQGRYDQAAEWFERIVIPPAGSKRLWTATMQMLRQVCQVLGTSPPEATPTTALPALPQPLAVHGRSVSEQPTLKIRNLGFFEVSRDQAILPVCKARKSIALFRYLLTRHHRTAHKEELMELLWPNAHPREAAHSLHVAVNSLRHHVDQRGVSYVLFEAGYYTVSPSAPLEVDCDTFEDLIDAAERYWRANDLFRAERTFSQAIACYQGDYFIDAHDLTWAVAKRERLLARYLSALDHLGQICFNQQLFEQAAECYQRLLERDGYREDAYCQLMRCYLELGRRSEALEQYKRCTSILASDLGLEPMHETQALYRVISGAGI
ncbi:MAG: BTAD domain-containing putative transcriptional regulator [Roseiflexaceae bacterium]